MRLYDFICQFMYDKDDISIYDENGLKYLIRGIRQEFIRNDFEELHNSEVESIDIDFEYNSIRINIWKM